MVHLRDRGHLVAGIHISSGIAGEFVDITFLNDASILDTGVATNASINFQSDGDVGQVTGGGGGSDIGVWITPQTGTPFTRYWIQRTLNSGSLDEDPGTGWLRLDTTRQWSTGATLTANLDFDIATDASGTNIISSATNVTLDATGV